MASAEATSVIFVAPRFLHPMTKMQPVMTMADPLIGYFSHGLPRIGRLEIRLFENNCRVAVAPPALLITGLGVKEQLTPVGNVAGEHASVIDSPAIPVPAVIEIGILAEPPAGTVMLAGATSAGAGMIVICFVSKFLTLAVEVAVMVICAGAGGGFGAVKSPVELSIVPALAVQVTSPLVA